MARYKVIPTKTNLLRLRRELNFTREGYELLEQKRQILVVEMMDLVDKAADAQEDVEKALVVAFAALQSAVIAMGRNSVKQLAPAVNIVPEISIKMRRLMGVNLPLVQLRVIDTPPYYSLEETSFWADETVYRFRGLLDNLGKLAESRISLMRIAEEVRKTMRRVNALDKIAMPDYRESIKYIEDTLEESEREMFATLKLVKERLGKKER